MPYHAIWVDTIFIGKVFAMLVKVVSCHFTMVCSQACTHTHAHSLARTQTHQVNWIMRCCWQQKKDEIVCRSYLYSTFSIWYSGVRCLASVARMKMLRKLLHRKQSEKNYYFICAVRVEDNDIENLFATNIQYGLRAAAFHQLIHLVSCSFYALIHHNSRIWTMSNNRQHDRHAANVRPEL